MGNAFVRMELFGEAEIGDVRPAVGIEQNVRRLEIAVQNAALVRVMHGPSD